ncbi:hypothetical protein [Streptomyces sp. H34-S4]|uniref:hypothetical protein n=1 Tax=Streptomyces sp. H34-S4 TaxID=2996463 RepID=UPI002270A3AD|nr:hypothetical protein [Streptomyces sp. H34-S4]MCY0938678.1 hypothetical protein [Streptomyces sp. H34-S4]
MTTGTPVVRATMGTPVAPVTTGTPVVRATMGTPAVRAITAIRAVPVTMGTLVGRAITGTRAVPVTTAIPAVRVPGSPGLPTALGPAPVLVLGQAPAPER